MNSTPTLNLAAHTFSRNISLIIPTSTLGPFPTESGITGGPVTPCL